MNRERVQPERRRPSSPERVVRGVMGSIVPKFIRSRESGELTGSRTSNGPFGRGLPPREANLLRIFLPGPPFLLQTLSQESVLGRTEWTKSTEWRESVLTVLGEISNSLKRLVKEVSGIRGILEDWYERRNQISLRDLISLPLNLLPSLGNLLTSTIGRSFGGIGSFLGGLLGNLMGRRLRRGREQAPKETGPRGVVALPDAERKRETAKGVVVATQGKDAQARGRGLRDVLGRVGGALLRGGGRVLGIAGLAALGYDFAQNLRQARELTGEGVGGLVKAIFASIASTLSLGLISPEVSAKFANQVGELLRSFAQRLGSLLEEAIGKVASFIRNSIDSARSFLEEAVRGIREGISGIGSRVGELLSSAKEAISSYLESARERVFSIASSVAEFFSSVAGRLKEAVSGAAGEVVGAVQRVGRAISESTTSLVSSISERVSKVLDSFRKSVEGISSFLSNLGSSLSNLASRVSQDPVGFLRELGTGLISRLKEIFTKPPQPATPAQPPGPSPAPPKKEETPGKKEPKGGYGDRPKTPPGGELEKLPPPPPLAQASVDITQPGSFQRLGDIDKRGLAEVYQSLVVPSVGRYPITQLIGQNRPYRDSFGRIINPLGYGQFGHMGIDIATPMGTPVRAPFDGVVVNESGGPWGVSAVLIGKNVAVRYSHLSSIDVPSGAVVKAGQVFARTGNTGNSTGPHLDITVYRARDGVRGAWISDYSVMSNLIRAEKSRKALSDKEIAEIQKKAMAQRRALGERAGVPGDTGVAPIASPFGSFLDNIAHYLSSLPLFQNLGIDLSAIRQRLSDSIARFSQYLSERNKSGRDVRELEQVAESVLGRRERAIFTPFIKREGESREVAIQRLIREGTRRSPATPSKGQSAPSKTPAGRAPRQDMPKGLALSVLSPKSGSLYDTYTSYRDKTQTEASRVSTLGSTPRQPTAPQTRPVASPRGQIPRTQTKASQTLRVESAGAKPGGEMASKLDEQTKKALAAKLATPSLGEKRSSETPARIAEAPRQERKMPMEDIKPSQYPVERGAPRPAISGSGLYEELLLLNTLLTKW